MGFDASDPTLAFVYVLEDDGKIVAAVGAKLTAEMRMVIDLQDTNWRPSFGRISCRYGQGRSRSCTAAVSRIALRLCRQLLRSGVTAWFERAG